MLVLRVVVCPPLVVVVTSYNLVSFSVQYICCIVVLAGDDDTATEGSSKGKLSKGFTLSESGVILGYLEVNYRDS